MDFNDELDFEPAEDLKESIVDSKIEESNIFNEKEQKKDDKEIKENLHEEFKKISESNNNIFESNIESVQTQESTSDTQDFLAVEFSDQFNKLKQQKDILNMNPELKTKVKRKSFFQKYAVVLPIFAFTLTLFLGLYIFASKTNANETNLIKIEEKGKIGYIDDKGEKIVNTKYMYGTDFYKGYAIVKNQNNLSGIINNKGDLTSHFGDYFYIERFSNNYIVSKFTNQGLKLGLLNASLHEITKFKYDNISYAKNNTFLFTRDDVMGIINQEGKEIYTFAVDETDNKDISIEVSNVPSDNLKDKYAKIKVNNSSTIINLATGDEVYSYTLEDIFVLDNNVFYIRKNGENNKFLVVGDNKLKYETTNYKLVRIEDFDSDIAVCLKSDMSYDYIDLNTKKVINNNENISYYYGSGLILENKNDFGQNEDKYWIKNTKRTLGEFSNIKLVDQKIVNKMIKVYTKNMKFNYINTQGNYINEQEYDTASDFDKFGYAIVSKDNLYGVINTSGKEVIPLKYENINAINEDLFEIMREKYNKDLFIYNSGNKVGIISTKDDIIIKASYDSFKFITTKYPIIIGNIDDEEIIINLDNMKEFDIKLEKDIEVHDNYIFVDNSYYNYDGKLIYKSQEG